MRARLRRGFAAVAAIALAITLLAISMTAPVVSSSADFSIFNSGWNGTSDLALTTYKAGKFAPSFTVKSSGSDLTVEQMGLDKISLAPRTDALIIIGPTKTFTTIEGRVVGDFVRAGGELLLADDFGTANSLLTGMNATSRFSRDLVMDLAYEKQPEFSVCFDFKQDPLTHNVTTVLLNYPSSLVISGNSSAVLARSSVASWRDTNGDRLQEWGEPRGPFPLLAREQLGSGTIVLLSDPSVLINGMSKNLDNEAFTTNLMSYICRDRSSVFFDESHRSFFDPITIALKFTGDVSANAKIGLVLLVLFFALWISSDMVDRSVQWTIRNFRHLLARIIGLFMPLFSRRVEPKPEVMDQEAIVRKLADEHPEWRIGLIRYLLREKSRHGKTLKEEQL